MQAKVFLVVLNRFLYFVSSLFFVSAIIFIVVHLTPGDIREIHNLSEATAKTLNLDKPLWIQFFIWLSHCLQGDFGISISNGTPVTELLIQYAPTTLWLTFGSIALSLLMSLPLGIFLGMKPTHWLGKALSIIVYSVSALPVFVIGYVVLAFIFAAFNFFSVTPPEGDFSFWPWFSYYVLPVLVLSIGNGTLGEFVRFISLETRNINGAMYIRAARARGVPLFRHFWRALLIPISTITVGNIAVLLGGVVVIERVFNFHGLGWLSWDATLKRDFSVILGITFLMAFIVRLFLFLNELLARFLDPRLR